MIRKLAGLALPILLTACDSGDFPETAPSGPVRMPIESVGAGRGRLPGTPMAQRVAVLGLLNKRNGLTRDLTMKPGEAVRLGEAIVRLIDETFRRMLVEVKQKY